MPLRQSPNDINWGKWIFFILLAAALFWGGLAIRLKYVDQSLAGQYARSMGVFSMFCGIIVFGTVLVTFILIHLKNK